MTYTINPNAKNVWIRDNEDTMDLSPITDASSVYLENGRTLEQELGEGSMVSNVATVDSAMSKVIDGTLDGAYESCVFKGKSLVNLFDKSKVSPDHTSYTLGSDNTITYVADNGFANGVKLNHLKPNTKYALFFDVLAASQEPNIPYRINDDGTNYNINIFGAGQDNPTSGFHSFTTGNNVSDLKFFFYTNLRNVGFKLTLPVIIEYQEDMENWDIPYFEGLCDVKMPILRNVGKNLANQSKYEIEAYVGGNDGVTVAIGSASKNTQSIIMEIEPNVSIVASSSSNSDRKVLACFNHFPTNGSKATKKTNNGYITTDTDTKYVMYYYNSNTVANGIVSQVQIEESPSPTQYEPYKTNILTTTRKNLFDMNRPYDAITDSQATVVQDTDQITVSSAESGIYVNANFILDKDFFAGKTVTGSCLYESDEKGIGTVQITYQDGNGDHHYQWIKTPRTFTFPNSFIGDVMLSISANNTGTPQSNTVTVKNIQLELGSTATSYEPYSEVVLRGIGDVQDTYNALTGEYTQRIEEVIFDGSVDETWSFSEMKGENYRFSIYLSRFGNGMTDRTPLICNRLKVGSVGQETTQEQIVVYNHTTSFEVRITLSPSTISSNNIDEFRRYLQENPVIIQYELAEPVTTIVEPSTIPFAYENGHVILESGYEGQSLLPAMEYSTTINKTGQIKNIGNTILRQEKQLTTMEKMLIQNIIDLGYSNALTKIKLAIEEVK